MLYKLSCWPIIQKVHCNIINYSNNISNCLFFYLFQYILILMVLFHPSLTVLYTLSDIQSYFFKIREWFPFVQTIFYLDSFTFIHKLRISTGLSPSMIMDSNIFLLPSSLNAIFNFAHHYFRNLYWFIFSFGTKMFQFPKYLVYINCFHSRVFIYCVDNFVLLLRPFPLYI